VRSCYFRLCQVNSGKFNLGQVRTAELSKPCTVYDRSNIGIAGSNPSRGMDVSAFFFVVLSCVGRSLALD
jgi:hypothetical protein